MIRNPVRAALLLTFSILGCKSVGTNTTQAADVGLPSPVAFLQPGTTGNAKISLLPMAVKAENYPDLQDFANTPQHIDDLLNQVSVSYQPAMGAHASKFIAAESADTADYLITLKSADIKITICPPLLGAVSSACANFAGADQVEYKITVGLSVQASAHPDSPAANSSGFKTLPKLTLPVTSIGNIKVHGGVASDESLSKALAAALDLALADIRINNGRPFRATCIDCNLGAFIDDSLVQK